MFFYESVPHRISKYFREMWQTTTRILQIICTHCIHNTIQVLNKKYQFVCMYLGVVVQGRTFSAIIKSFLTLSSPLNDVYLPIYNTKEGSKFTLYQSTARIWLIHDYFYSIIETVYDATMNSVKETFPEYIRELEGVADGANVDFHKVFQTLAQK